jgi:hypothetical protein
MASATSRPVKRFAGRPVKTIQSDFPWKGMVDMSGDDLWRKVSKPIVVGVNSDKMKVEQKDHELVITIPKA